MGNECTSFPYWLTRRLLQGNIWCWRRPRIHSNITEGVFKIHRHRSSAVLIKQWKRWHSTWFSPLKVHHAHANNWLVFSPLHFYPWYYLHVHSLHTIKHHWDNYVRLFCLPETSITRECKHNHKHCSSNKKLLYQLSSRTMYSTTLIIRASTVWTLWWPKHSTSVQAWVCRFISTV